jgi:hypothetical protein
MGTAIDSGLLTCSFHRRPNPAPVFHSAEFLSERGTFGEVLGSAPWAGNQSAVLYRQTLSSGYLRVETDTPNRLHAVEEVAFLRFEFCVGEDAGGVELCEFADLGRYVVLDADCPPCPDYVAEVTDAALWTVWRSRRKGAYKVPTSPPKKHKRHKRMRRETMRNTLNN